MPKRKKKESKEVKIKRLKINYIHCLKCDEVLYSRARHDFRYCSCKNVMVDGGLEYFRCGWNIPEFETGTSFIHATEQMLYEDWYMSKDKYGTL